MRISDWSSDVCSSDLTFNDKLDYLVGAYYFSEGGTESEDVAFPGGLLQIVGDYRFKTKSYALRSEEHTSELQSLTRISYAVFCLKKKKKINQDNRITTT